MFAIFIYVIAGLGAGIATGLAGLSAAVVISPMLITFLHMDAYTAVGIALASDVLASAASAITYGKNKNIDIKRGFMMLASVLVFTFVGSYVASLLCGNYDVIFGFALYHQTRYGRQTGKGRKYRCRLYKVRIERRSYRFRLRFRRGRRRNDDAVGFDKCFGV